MKKLNNRGFTIIELLIATVSFSLILLVITGAIIQFSSLYYKGVVTSKTQEVARAVADDIARSAQFGSEDPQTIAPSPFTNGYGAICIGSKHYNFTLNKMLGENVTHVLTADTRPGCAPYDGNSATPATASELLGDKMQLLRLTASKDAATGIITVEVTVAYGSAGDMNDDNADGTPDSCKTLKLGGQFCAISNVKTTVTKRL